MTSTEQQTTKAASALDKDLKPSHVTDAYWLCAECNAGHYPKHTEWGGKWLIFVTVAQTDDIWAKIRTAIKDGRLGSTAKVATAKPNPNASNLQNKVICVFTYDWRDEEDVRRIRQALYELGITSAIPYKADEDTYSGRYANRGNKRISKYYE